MLLVVFLVSALLFYVRNAFSQSSTCTQQIDNNCAAVCEVGDVNISLDISNIFKYPHRIDVDPKSPDAGSIESFTFSCQGDDKCNDKDNPTSVCSIDTNSVVTSCGIAVNAEWTLVDQSPLLYTIKYIGGKCQGTSCKQSIFTFVENKDSQNNAVEFVRVDQTGTKEIYRFDVVGPCIGQANCKYPSSSVGAGRLAGIAGFALILAAVLAVVGYFGVGSCIMYFGKGARGKEIIPHVEFWSDLPYLIWDGCLFVVSPLSRRKSYDPITDK